jgi:N-acetylmuramoyl-L-alanine amidase
MNPEIREDFLSYVQRLDSRPGGSIDLLVIHCTELPDLATARVFGEKIHYPESSTGNSGHFYIDRDGLIEQWVPLDRVAHHVRGHNPRSIGIELVNNGRYPDWFHSGRQQMKEPYPAQQIEALVKLVNHLGEHLPGLKNVAGHEDLDTAWIPSEDSPATRIRRKLDPGPHFPWASFMKRIPLRRLLAEDR